MYSAGTVFLEVVPSFKGFQDAVGRKAREQGKKLGEETAKGYDEGLGDGVDDSVGKAMDRAGRDSERSASKAGDRAGKGFSGAFRKAIDAANREAVAGLGKGVDAELDRVQKRLKQVGKLKIGVDVTAQEAIAELAAIEKAMDALSKSDVDIEVRMNAAAATAELEGFRRRVQAIDNLRVEASVDIEVNEGNFQRKVIQAAQKARAALRDLSFDVTPSLDLSQIDSELAGLYARLESLGNPELTIELDDQQISREARALKLEIERILSRVDIDIETRSNLADALGEIAPLAAALEALDGRDIDINVDVDGTAAATAQLAALRAQTAATRNESLDAANAFRGFSGIVLGVAALGPLIIPVLAGIVAMLIAIGPAVAAAVVGLGGLILGFTGIGAAVTALGDVEKNGAKERLAATKSLRSAANGVRDAEEAVGRAREQAAEGAEQASRRVSDAVKSQADAERDLRDALTDQTQAQRNLVLARVEAQRQLEDLELRAAGGALAQRQANLDLARATARFQTVMTGAPGEYDSATREQAAIDLERQKLQVEELANEQERLTEQQADAAKNGLESTEAMKTAREQLARADEGVASAQERQVEATQAVADAQRDQARQVLDGQRAIADAIKRQSDAQVAYQEALRQTGEIGSASMQKLREAMDNLGPAGQAFSIFLFGLRDEFQEFRNAIQEGLLPGVQDGITSLMDAYGPDLLLFLRELGGVLGQLFRDAAEGLQSPEWKAFFKMIGEQGPTLLTLWAGILGNVGTTIASLLTAFAPFAVEFAEAFLEITEGWAEWAAQLRDDPEFQEFLDYLKGLGPEIIDFLLAFAGAMLNLAVALAPYAEDLMRGFTAILAFIADMDPKTLGIIAVSIITIVVAVQTLFGIMALVIGGGVVFGAISALAAALGLTGTALAATAGTVAAIAGAIVAAVILIASAVYQLYSNSAGFKEFVDGLALKVAEFHLYMRDEFIGDMKQVWENFMGGVQGVIDFFQPAIDVLTDVWDGMADRWDDIYQNVLKPIFELFGAIVTSIFDEIIKPAFEDAGVAFEAMGAFFSWIYNEVLGPVFELFGAIVSTVYNATLKPLFEAMGDKFEAIGLLIQYVWDTYIKPTLEVFGNFIADTLEPLFTAGIEKIGAIWDSLREKMKAPVRFFVDTVINGALVGTFNHLANLFGTTPIKPFQLPASFDAKAPNVGNRGGRSQQYDVGGYTGHGGKYEPAGVVHRSEYVFRKEATDKLRRRFGLGFLDYINQTGQIPGFASGGLVGFGRELQRRGFRVSEHSAFGGRPTGGHSKNSLHYSDQAIDVNWAPGTSPAEQRAIDAIVPLAREYGLRTIWRVADHFNHAHFDTGGSRNLIGKITGMVGDLASGPLDTMKAAFDKVVGTIPGGTTMVELLGGFGSKMMQMMVDKLTSVVGAVTDIGNGDTDIKSSSARDAVRSAAAGYGWDTGGMWEALQWIVNKESSFNPNAQNPTSTAYGLFQFLNGTWKGTGYSKSSNPDVQAAAGLKYIASRYGNPVAAKAFHQSRGYYADGGLVEPMAATMYDNGGYLPPGLSTVLNLTGKPEPVFTDEQWKRLESGGGSGPGVNLTFHGRDWTPSDVSDEVVHAVTVLDRGGKYRKGR